MASVIIFGLMLSSSVKVHPSPTELRFLVITGMFVAFGIWSIVNGINERIILAGDQLIHVDWMKKHTAVPMTEIHEFKRATSPLISKPYYDIVGSNVKWRVSSEMPLFDEFKARMDGIVQQNAHLVREPITGTAPPFLVG